DIEVIKTILAITNDPNRRPEPYHVVAELHDLSNLEATRLVGKDELEVVIVGDVVSRIIAQTCRQPGLSIVYGELLDFDGDEIYFSHQPALAGRPLRRGTVRVRGFDVDRARDGRWRSPRPAAGLHPDRS